MKRRAQPLNKPALAGSKSQASQGDIGIVLSGGGSRAAYQVGALKALVPYIEATGSKVSVVVGSSIGAVNGLTLSSCLKSGLPTAVTELEGIWRERTFRNTFAGSPSTAFLRAIKVAFLRYTSPGPEATDEAIFDPTPLMEHLDSVIRAQGGLEPANRDPNLKAVAVMTTIEGKERKPLLFLSAQKKLEPALLSGAMFSVHYVDALTAKHGLASAALPSVLPPVELDVEGGTVRLVDGGISINIPVDPAVRLGAERVIVIDISGREWWLNHYGEPHDTRPTWEVPAGVETFCLRPPATFVAKNRKALGPLLKNSVAHSTREFIKALGPTWPIFTLLKKKLGEDLAYEVMSYVALHPDYIHALIEEGYNETLALLRQGTEINFERPESFDLWYKKI